MFSSRLMAFLLLAFAISIAIATFIESADGTSTARALVYNALWFELLLSLAFINLCGVMITSKMYTRKKLPMFIFHLALLLILTGAAITRFLGEDGYMHIREGNSSDEIVSNDIYFRATAINNGQVASASKLIYISNFGNNYHSITLKTHDVKVLIECLDIIPNTLKSGGMNVADTGLNAGDYAVHLRITASGQSKMVNYYIRTEGLNDPVNIKLANTDITVNIGAKKTRIPFSLKLNKFVIEHYPGSESPSWFESKILLLDPVHNIKLDSRIFMNNVLNYQGYRFFQSSYDTDELGTILSVNHDYWGTLISYLGYLILALGIILSFFNPDSRIRKLYRELSQIDMRKTLTILLLLVFAGFASSVKAGNQDGISDTVIVNKAHAAKFGELLVQDPGGRIKPINTLSSELIRKITYNTTFSGLSNDQVFLGMMIYPQYWQNTPMIRVSNSEIKKLLNVTGNYASFMDVLSLVGGKQEYLLETQVNVAYHKKPGIRNKFDNDIIKVDERVNLCYMIYTGELLNIFPKKDDPKLKWYSPGNAGSSFKGNDSVFTNIIIPLYFRSLKEAIKTGDWSKPDEIIGLINNYQVKYGSGIIPSPVKKKIEILYNRLDIFQLLTSVYGLVGFILLVAGFSEDFYSRAEINILINISVTVLVICFIVIVRD